MWKNLELSYSVGRNVKWQNQETDSLKVDHTPNI